MNALLAYNKIIEELVAETGMTKPEKNQEGGYTFILGKDCVVDFSYDEANGWFVLKAKVGDLTQGREFAWLQRIAVANLLWRETKGSTLSLEPRSGSIVLANYRPLQGFDMKQLRYLLHDFLATMRDWQQKLQGEPESFNGHSEGEDPTRLLNRLV